MQTRPPLCPQSLNNCCLDRNGLTFSSRGPPGTLFDEEVGVVSGITSTGDFFPFLMLGCHIDKETRREAAQGEGRRGEERTLPHQILQVLQDKPRVKHNYNQESRAVKTNWEETVVEFIFVFLFLTLKVGQLTVKV